MILVKKVPKKAIITVGGLSSLFLPISKFYPREMLPIGDKPIIQYVVEEAKSLGIKDKNIAIIYNRYHKLVKNYFEDDYGAEEILEKRKQFSKLKLLSDYNPDSKIRCICQGEPNGLAHAICCSKRPPEYIEVNNGREKINDCVNPFINNNESFILMLGDVLTKKDSKITKNLIDAYKHYRSHIFSVKNISPFDVENFGVIRGSEIGNDIYKIRNLHEKPKIQESPSHLAIMGRYIFENDIFNYIDNEINEKKPKSHEKISFVDVMNNLLEKNEKEIYAQRIREKSFRVWNKVNYLKTAIELSIDDEDIKKNIINFLDDKNKDYRNTIMQG